MTNPLNVRLDELEARKEDARSRVRKLKAEAQTLHDSAKERALSPGEQTRWDNLLRGIRNAEDELESARDETAAAMLEGVRSGRLQVESGDGATGGPATYRHDEVPADPWARARYEDRGRALRMIEITPHASDDQRQLATQLVESDPTGVAARWAIVAGDPNYLRCYTSLLIDPERAHLKWNDAERAAFAAADDLTRAMAIGSPGTGGYMVPFTLDPAIILTNAGTINPLRSIARKVTTSTSSWNGVSSDGVTAEWKAEADEAADASPTLAQPSIDVHLADAFVPYSIEAEQDAAQLVSELQAAMLDAKDRLEATAFTLGNGTTAPHGIITAVAADAGSLVTPTTAETFAVADIYKVAAALPARHQANARWMANHTLEYTVRQFASGSGPTHAFWADFTDGTPSKLLGKPWHGCSDMDGTYDAAATATNYLLLLGDFSKFVIVDRIGARTEIIPHLVGANRRPTGQRGLFMYWRTGSGATDTNAFRLLNIATTA